MCVCERESLRVCERESAHNVANARCLVHDKVACARAKSILQHACNISYLRSSRVAPELQDALTHGWHVVL